MNNQTILNIRGTNGAGKTTLVRGLMTAIGGLDPIYALAGEANGGRPIGYSLRPDGKRTLLKIVGRYGETACGGCDTIKTTEEVMKLVTRFAKTAPVVFEGVLISTVFSSWRDFFAQWLEEDARRKVVVGYLDTPLETCIARVNGRRLTAGNTKAFDPSQLTAKFSSIDRTRLKFRGVHERLEVHTLRHQHAVLDARKALGV